MDPRGNARSEDPLAEPIFQALADVWRRDAESEARRRARSDQGAVAPESLAEISGFLRDQALRAITAGQNDAEKERNVPEISPEATITELRTQLAEARNDRKLADAIGESTTRHAELIGKMENGFTELKGQISSLNTRLNSIEKSTAGLKGTVIVTAVAAIAVIIAVLAYGQTWFGIGVSTRDVVRATVTELTQANKQPPPAPAAAPGHPGG